ncbi:MAG: D-aminoacyl-tRNA deacylase [Verrucomicrobiota bacterium]|nr:D-aminoacyl-tRNA deacylase [Verrucomicrobiota bacterium]MED5452944.1 D-aminoacyl-tRNA deacylase [Verrucomicrobiota bacterium]|tara:strand:+ start:424 stop:876 length:453 start_codon:yes stop_codon:yes gene_type:complete
MRVVIQRVSKASVSINKKIRGEIAKGLLILLGIEETDTIEDIKWLCSKISRMRIFTDNNGLMNNSILDIKGDILLISQFTLFASTKKGNRPSFSKAATPDKAIPLYEKFIHYIQTELGKPIQTGEFGADMKVTLTNDGPVTITIDSKSKE